MQLQLPGPKADALTCHAFVFAPRHSPGTLIYTPCAVCSFVSADAPVLSLTHPVYSDWTDMTTYSALAAMNRDVGGGVVELRADMLAEKSESFVHEQISLIRRHLPEDVPLRFVLRTVHQGGKFEGSEEDVFRILGYALKAGVEIIDVELYKWSDVARDALRAQCRNTRLRPYLRPAML